MSTVRAGSSTGSGPQWRRHEIPNTHFPRRVRHRAAEQPILHALDGLRGAASDRAWAECFTPDGRFRLFDAHGTTIAEAKGTEALVELYASFPGVATTRHWVNNLLMEKAGDRARTTCYIIAMDIGRVPSKIAKKEFYTDDLTEMASGWRYTNRTLALDPNSLPPS